MEVEVEKICNLQERLIEDWHNGQDKEIKEEGFLFLVLKNHLKNFKLWHEEDKAREVGVQDKVIADVKRKIDVLNQERNDFIEKIDEFLLNSLDKRDFGEPVEINSETLGNIFDRLSINALKIYHMKEELGGSMSNSQYQDKCSFKLTILKEQREDLIFCLKKLIQDILSGKKRMKVYKQFKMYNDPESNPILRESLKKRDFI